MVTPMTAICSSNSFFLVAALFLILSSSFVVVVVNGQNDNMWCGSSWDDVILNCIQSCPNGDGCPTGTYCMSGVTACDSSGNSIAVVDGLDTATTTTTTTTATTWNANMLAATTPSTVVGMDIDYDPSETVGAAAVKQIFASLEAVIDTKLFLSETPSFGWVPSTVYKFDGFYAALQIVHSTGVANHKLYLGGDCSHCHMYGLINVAAFLAQAMKETIRYDACDENSWDRVGTGLMYPISNACGQLKQSYQDYNCADDEKHMECAVDPDMTITAVTHAKWWGAPGPLKCGPTSLYPHTGYWDFTQQCGGDPSWGGIPCDDYEGQKGGGEVNTMPYANGAGRTDVQGCCWWGRGVIQTTGVCNFGKLNYFLGKGAADAGRESRYPTVDFCKDPEVICSSTEYSELKWIAGFFYWMNEVQQYNKDGWNYITELHKYVDEGMQGDDFINAVSGIVNRGCHNPPCGTGDLDGGPERATNFAKVLAEMEFAFVEVVPGQIPPDLTSVVTDVAPTQAMNDSPTPATTPGNPDNSRPSELNEIFPAETVVIPVTEPADSLVTGQSSMHKFQCGNKNNADYSKFLGLSFWYELHADSSVSKSDVLLEVKSSIMSQTAYMIGCTESVKMNRALQSGDPLELSKENVRAIESSLVDIPQDSPCSINVDSLTMDVPTTCYSMQGEMAAIFDEKTSDEVMNVVRDEILLSISMNMALGSYESSTAKKLIYGNFIESRIISFPSSQEEKSEDGKNKTGIVIATLFICFTIVLLGMLLFVFRKRRMLSNTEHSGDGSNAITWRVALDDTGKSFKEALESYKSNPNKSGLLEQSRSRLDDFVDSSGSGDDDNYYDNDRETTIEIEIQSMTTQAIKEELKSRGIDTKSLINRREFVNALLLASDCERHEITRNRQIRRPRHDNDDSSNIGDLSVSEKQDNQSVYSMKTSVIKSELKSLGISITSFVDKRDLADALLHAREERVGQDGASTASSRSVHYSSSASSKKSKHSATASIPLPPPVPPPYVTTQDVRTMKIGAIKAELESFGISSKSFVEKRDLVDALLLARGTSDSDVISTVSDTISQDKSKVSNLNYDTVEDQRHNGNTDDEESESGWSVDVDTGVGDNNDVEASDEDNHGEDDESPDNESFYRTINGTIQALQQSQD